MSETEQKKVWALLKSPIPFHFGFVYIYRKNIQIFLIQIKQRKSTGVSRKIKPFNDYSTKSVLTCKCTNFGFGAANFSGTLCWNSGKFCWIKCTIARYCPLAKLKLILFSIFIDTDTVFFNSVFFNLKFRPA